MAVRALPPAKGATSAELAEDLDAAIEKAQRKLARRDRQRAAGPDEEPASAGSEGVMDQ